MQIRSGRAVKTLALGALLTVGVSGFCTAQGTRDKSENSLLGITLLKSSFRDVLKKFGRPNEIQAGGPFLPSEGAPTGAAPRPSGGFGGSSGFPGVSGGGYPGSGGPAAGGGGRAGGGGNRVTSKTGFPGKGGSSAASPGSAGGGYPGGGGGYPGSSGGGYPGVSGGGLPGFGAPGGSSGYPGGSSGYPGAPGSYSGGSSGMSGGPGGPPGASGGGDNEAAAEYEATWWYHDRKDGLHISFLFNRDGRVIQIQEYGPDINHKAGKTRLGVTLGSGMNTVLRQYGWSNDGANDGRNVILRFGGEEKVAFQLVNNVVRGITVAVVKETPVTHEP